MKKARLLLIIPVVAAAALAHRILRKPEFLYAGTVEATEVDVSARVGSLIEGYDVKEGETVKAGATLVRLACEDVRLDEALARRNYERGDQLRRAGTLPAEAYDKLVHLKNETALKLDWCTIRAPIEGTVLSTYQEADELAAPGMKLLTLADLREVWAVVYVPQPMLAKLSYGLEVPAVLPEAPGLELRGRVAHIRDEAEFTPKNVQTREERTRLVYGIKVVFPNAERILKPGMTVEVRLPE